MTNAGYDIIEKERFRVEGNREEYVVLGRMNGRFGMQYVTWRATLVFGVGDWSFYWGHYFKDDEAAARADYHERLFNEWSFIADEDNKLAEITMRAL